MVHTKGVLVILWMVVQRFGKQISSAYWRGRVLNLINLASVIMLLNSQCLRQMCKDTSRRIIVGNIHVLYNPRRGDIKLGQIRFLASRAHFLSKKWGGAPIVLAGDYNSTPQSAVYNFLLSSELNIMLHDRRDLSGQKNCLPTQALGLRRENGSLFVMMDRFFRQGWTNEEVKTATGSTSCWVVVHPLKLNSSYATVKGSTRTRNSYGEPLATSYHSKFLGTVDYLWYSNGLVPTKVLDTLPLNILKKTGGLPCEVGEPSAF